MMCRNSDYVSRSDFELQCARADKLKQNAQTLAEFMTRIKLSTTNRDHARTERHVQQAMHYIDQHGKDWAN